MGADTGKNQGDGARRVGGDRAGGGSAGRTAASAPKTAQGPDRPATAPAGARSNVTGRAAVLALIVCLLAISLAYPLREYLTQRGDIRDYRAQVSEQATQVSQLEKQKKRWTSDAHVQAQARERLHYVMPGETAYIVLGGEEMANPDGVLATTSSRGVRSPWFTDLWRSVEAAGSTKAAAARP